MSLRKESDCSLSATQRIVRLGFIRFPNCFFRAPGNTALATWNFFEEESKSELHPKRRGAEL
jgi:hypothetical protein